MYNLIKNILSIGEFMDQRNHRFDASLANIESKKNKYRNKQNFTKDRFGYVEEFSIDEFDQTINFIKKEIKKQCINGKFYCVLDFKPDFTTQAIVALQSLGYDVTLKILRTDVKILIIEW